MGHRILVICDSEMLYAKNLMDMIVQRKELALQVRVFSSVEKLQIFSKESAIDFLLIDEVYALELRREIKANKVFVITRGVGSIMEDGEISLYKYQAANEIIEQILGECKEEGENLFLHNNKGKIKAIGVYSPIHRVGKSNFSIALGKEIAKKKKTLYLSMEPYAGSISGFQTEGDSLGDLIYYAKQEHSNVGMRLATMVKKKGELDYVEPISVVMDLKTVTCEEWQLLLHKIKVRSAYETIIMDLDESVQGLIELLKECEIIYMPILEEPVAKAKVRQYEENMKLLGAESVLERTKQVYLPEEEEIRAYVKKLLEAEDAL